MLINASEHANIKIMLATCISASNMLAYANMLKSCWQHASKHANHAKIMLATC